MLLWAWALLGLGAAPCHSVDRKHWTVLWVSEAWSHLLGVSVTVGSLPRFCVSVSLS